MSILTNDQYLAAAKQVLTISKTATRTSVAAQPFSVFDIAGNPGAGTLAVGDIVNGIVPTQAVAGYPGINAFGGGATGYITGAEFGNTVASRLVVYDRLFSCGAFAFNANVTLAAQPSFVSRLPGSNYKGLEIWVEMVTAATGNQAVAVTYTDDAGATGHATGAVGISAAPTVGRMWQLPLAAGDKGVQTIETIVGSVASAGTFNVHVLRHLWTGRVKSVSDGGNHNWLQTKARQVFATSALFLVVFADSTSTGLPDVHLEIANA
jgi:hypothetical protein